MSADNLPTLLHADLRSELVVRFERERSRHHAPRRLVAFIGRCEPGVIDVQGFGPVEVVPVDCELSLRRSLPDPHEDTARAYVLAYSEISVPKDLAGRFLDRGEVVRIDRLERLRRVFAIDEKHNFVILDPSLQDSALGRFLVHSNAATLQLQGGAARITLDDAYQHWLSQRLGLADGRDALLAWASKSAEVAKFKADTDPTSVPEAKGLHDEVLAYLVRRNGPIAALIWRAWLAGSGLRLLELAVLCEALSDNVDTHALYLISEARHRGVVETTEDAQLLRENLRELGQSVETALLTLPETSVQQIIEAADAYIDADARANFVASPRLPASWKVRLDALGEALRAAADRPTLGTFESAKQRMQALDQHRFARAKPERRTIECAEMALRLLAWLVVRTDPRAGAMQAWSECEAIARWYAHEGGRIDLARRRARASGKGSFPEGVAAVLARVDAVRDDLDRRFAKGLVAWLEADRPTRRLLPIDRCADVFGAQFISGAPLASPRRLLVILIDGMAWAQAIELLDALDGEAHRGWRPIAYKPKAPELDAGDVFTPVLASLPTTTEASRAAFFSGRPLVGTQKITGDDEKRWASHPAFVNIGSGPLFLRGDFESDGTAKPHIHTAIADISKPVVAVVINAIDAALKGETQDEAPWTIDRITPLRELLDAALVANRAVLFTSDHGNVSGQRFTHAGVQSEGKPRYRMRKASDSLREFEIEIPISHAYLPGVDATRGVVLITDDAHTYKGGSSHGEHGGASLAEVVVPTVLLGTDMLSRSAAGDPDLALRPVKVPNWWYLDIRETKGRVEAIDKELVLQHPPSTQQLSLISVTDMANDAERRAQVRQQVVDREAKGKAAVSEQTRALVKALEKSPLFQSKARVPERRQELLVCLEYLLERGGQAGDEAFAAAVGKHRRQVAGLVATLSNVLNVDGYEVLRHDAAARVVVVDEGLLRGLFGLERST